MNKISNFRKINNYSNIIRLKHRSGQYKFRQEISNLYNYKCALTNTHYSLCDACHIFPYKNCNINEKYDVYNGILLTPTLHRAYDKNYFYIDEDDCKFKINKIFLDNLKIDYLFLEKYDEKFISTLDNEKSKKYIHQRNKLNEFYKH